ncbi:MAG: MFS transporter [Gemmatimonadaceae bacterium]|nr:MFS transporter [Chitinophagaceae bacterium]
MPSNIRRNQLFVASCLALLVTSLSFGIRAGILDKLGVQFGLDKAELATIAATAFWGFPLAVIIGGFVVDVIGMKRLLVFAFILHLVGIILTIFAGSFSNPFWALFLSTLSIGMANGTVEAACNPLVTALYPDNKTTKLNHFHLWFPGGIVLGTLIVYMLDQVNFGGIDAWKIEVALMIIPTLIYGYLFSRLSFPPTERVSKGISTGEMYRSLANPLFIFMLICMFGTAITELYTGQWIGVLLRNVTDQSLLILTVTTGVMVVGRAFAEPIVHRLSPVGVLVMSAILATLGLYLLGHTSGNMVFVGALVFGIGVCFFWPTMLGFVAENLPKTGAVGLNLMGGVGMLAVSLYTMFMGGYYNRLIAGKLPAGADFNQYNSSPAGSEMRVALDEANRQAGPEVINVTMTIPIILTVAFIGLYFYMRSRKGTNMQTVA